MQLARRHFPIGPVLAVTLSSLLQTAIFPMAGPLPFWRACLAWIALAPWFSLLLRYPADDERLIWKLTGWSYLCGALWNLGHCYWVYDTMAEYGGMSHGIAALILCLYCLYLGLYHAAFGAAVAVLRQRQRLPSLHWLWMFPAIWIATEMGKAHITSEPWDLLGYSQVDHAVLTELAPYVGTYGIACLIAAANTAFALAVVSRGKAERSAAAVSAVAVGVLIVLGFTIKPTRPVAPETAVLVQPNLEPGTEATTPEGPLLQDLTGRSLSPASNPFGVSSNIALIVWPEAPSPFQVGEAKFDGALTSLAHTTGATVISGATAIQADVRAPRRYRVYNSAALFTPGGGYSGRYDKIHLVPFGEFVPYEWLFSFAGGLTQQVGRTDRGQHRLPLRAGGHRYGTFICYESIFAEEIRQFAKQGADLLVNISDDGWYGDTSAPFQHMNMARMRAIENRRWLLRDTNTGITASIDPYGTVREQAPRQERTSILVHFAYNQQLTFYTRHGDWFAYACTTLAVALLLVSLATDGRLTDGKLRQNGLVEPQQPAAAEV